MKNFADILKYLGDDFVNQMEEQKKLRLLEIFPFIIKSMEIQKYVDLNSKEGKVLCEILNKFYEYGYYAGIHFMLDPDADYSEVVKKMYDNLDLSKIEKELTNKDNFYGE